MIFSYVLKLFFLPNCVELFLFVDVGEPEAEQGSVLVAVASRLTLDVGHGHEVLETRTGGQQVLTRALGTLGSVHYETVAGPHVEPAGRTIGYGLILRVHGDHVADRLAHRASTDEVLDTRTVDGTHARRHRLGGR